MNVRLQMLETGYSIFAEEIESLNKSNQGINDNDNDENDTPFYQRILLNQLSAKNKDG